MTTTCTRRIQFCAGHRVMGHENKCAHLHGHNYVVLLEAEAVTGEPALDGIGRVIDFSVLKEKIGGWIDRMWDHGFLLFIDDNEAIRQVKNFRPSDEQPIQKFFEMPTNPTAENIAAYLLKTVGPLALAGTGVRLVGVTVWETENCKAEVRLE